MKLRGFLFLLLAALAVRSVAADRTIVAMDYDADSLTYYYPLLVGQAPVNRLVTTSGVSSTTLTSVNSDVPFASVSVGDVLLLPQTSSTTGARTGTEARRVLAKASGNSITLDDSILIASAGSGFSWLKESGGAASTSGWFSYPVNGIMTAIVDAEQVSTTGDVTYKLECRHILSGNVATNPVILAGPTVIAQADVDRVAVSAEAYDQCRVGVLVTTADDDVITISATTDNIDWKEYVNSYTVAASNDLDFVEDVGGTPITCNADVAAGTYTGAALAALITTEMNDDVANCGGGTLANTYTATYSTTTHLFTIARTTGTATIDLLWATGTNTATSMKTLLGYSNADDTAGTSYAADSATGESAEINTVLDAGVYATGDLACAEIAAEMTGDATAATVSCSYSVADDKITISATGIAQLMILWNSGTNNATSADQHLGFSADSTGALSYEGAAIGMNDSAEVEKITITIASPGDR